MAVGLRTQFETDRQEPEVTWARLILQDAAYPGTN